MIQILMRCITGANLPPVDAGINRELRVRARLAERIRPGSHLPHRGLVPKHLLELTRFHIRELVEAHVVGLPPALVLGVVLGHKVKVKSKGREAQRMLSSFVPTIELPDNVQFSHGKGHPRCEPP